MYRENNRTIARLLTLALFTSAALYAIALVSALTHGGCCLFYQTERLHESISVFKHTWIGVAAYGTLCCALVGAALALLKNKGLALGLLLVAIPILANDTAGALYDAFMAIPWVPKRGAPFEAFFNEQRIPQKVWYAVLGATVAAAVFCGWHAASSRYRGVVSENRDTT